MSFRVDTYISPISPRVCKNTARSKGQGQHKIPPLSGTFERKGPNLFKPVNTQEKSAPSAVATGYINRPASTIAITNVLRSLQSTSIKQPRSNTSRCHDGSCTPSFASIYDILSLHTYFGASPATMKYICSKCNKVFGRN